MVFFPFSGERSPQELKEQNAAAEARLEERKRGAVICCCALLIVSLMLLIVRFQQIRKLGRKSKSSLTGWSSMKSMSRQQCAIGTE